MNLTLLTARERYILTLLERLESDTIWTLGVKEFLKAPTVELFKRLLASLASQQRDCAEVMLAILGRELFLAVQLHALLTEPAEGSTEVPQLGVDTKKVSKKFVASPK